MSQNKIVSRQLKRPQQYSFRNGRYEGGVVNAKRQGVGMCVINDGSIAIGEWLNDKLHGEALIFLPNVGVIQGEYCNGNPGKDNLLQIAVLYEDNISVAFQMESGGNGIKGTCWNDRIGFEFSYESNECVLKEIPFWEYEKYMEAVSALRNMSLLTKQQFKDALNATQTDYNSHQTRYTLAKQQQYQSSLGCVIDRYSLEVIQTGTYVNSQLDGLARVIVNTTTKDDGGLNNHNNKANLKRYHNREYLDCIFIKGKIASAASNSSNNRQFTVIPNEPLLPHNKEHQLFLQTQHKCSPDYFDVSVNTKELLPYEYLFLKELPMRIEATIAAKGVCQYVPIEREAQKYQQLYTLSEQIPMSELFKGPFTQSIDVLDSISAKQANLNSFDQYSQQLDAYQNNYTYKQVNQQENIQCDQISSTGNQIKEAYLFSAESADYCRSLVDKIENIPVEQKTKEDEIIDTKQARQDSQSHQQTGTHAVKDGLCYLETTLPSIVENITADAVTNLQIQNNDEKAKKSQCAVQSNKTPSSSLASLRAGKHFKGFYNEKDIKVTPKRDRSSNKTSQDVVFTYADQGQVNVHTEGEFINAVNKRQSQINIKTQSNSNIDRKGCSSTLEQAEENNSNKINSKHGNNGFEKIEEIVFNKTTPKQQHLSSQQKWKSSDKSPYQHKSISTKQEANEITLAEQLVRNAKMEGNNNNRKSLNWERREREANQRQNKAWQSVLYPNRPNNKTIMTSVSPRNESNQTNKSARIYQKRQHTITLGDNYQIEKSNSKGKKSLSPCIQRRQLLSCRNAKPSHLVDDKENNLENTLQNDRSATNKEGEKNWRNQRCQTLTEGGYLLKMEETSKQYNEDQSNFRCLQERKDKSDNCNSQNINCIMTGNHKPNRSSDRNKEKNYQESNRQDSDSQLNRIEKSSKLLNQASLDQEKTHTQRQNLHEKQSFKINISKSYLHVDSKDGMFNQPLNILPVCLQMERQQQNSTPTHNHYTLLQKGITNLPSPSRDECLDREYFSQLKCNLGSLEFPTLAQNQILQVLQQNDKDNQSTSNNNSPIYVDYANNNGICSVMNPDLPEKPRLQDCQLESQQTINQCFKQHQQYYGIDQLFSHQISAGALLNQQLAPKYPMFAYSNGELQGKDIPQQYNPITNGNSHNNNIRLTYQDFHNSIISQPIYGNSANPQQQQQQYQQEQSQDRIKVASPRSCFTLNYYNKDNSNALIQKADQFPHSSKGITQAQSSKNNNTTCMTKASCYSPLQSRDITPDRQFFRKQHPSIFVDNQSQQISSQQQQLNSY